MLMKRNLLIISGFVVLTFLGVLMALNREGIIKVFDFKKDCTPFNLLVDKEKDVIKITWETKDTCTGIVKFGDDIEDLKYWLTAESEKGMNQVEIDKGKYKDIRYFIIISNGELFGLDGKAVKVN